MILVNHDLKAIYIHLHKCGGMYIGTVLINFYNFFEVTKSIRDDNVTPIDANEFNFEHNLRCINDGVVKTSQRLLPDEVWDTYTKFTFIRNPYERVLSGYLFSKKDYEMYSKNYYNNTKYCDINLFESMNIMFKHKDILSPYTIVHTMVGQYRSLLNKNNEININYIYNFDNLEAGLNEILSKLGITNTELHVKVEKQNVSFREHDISYYFDDETINYVNEIAEEDFINLNYKKFNNKDDMIQFYNSYSKVEKTLLFEYKNECFIKT